MSPGKGVPDSPRIQGSRIPHHRQTHIRGRALSCGRLSSGSKSLLKHLQWTFDDHFFDSSVGSGCTDSRAGQALWMVKVIKIDYPLKRSSNGGFCQGQLGQPPAKKYKVLGQRGKCRSSPGAAFGHAGSSLWVLPGLSSPDWQPHACRQLKPAASQASIMSIYSRVARPIWNVMSPALG